jgi:hypothetical protein
MSPLSFRVKMLNVSVIPRVKMLNVSVILASEDA